jgi:hypothetical protein
MELRPKAQAAGESGRQFQATVSAARGVAVPTPLLADLS